MVLKTLVIFTWAIASYLALLLWSASWWSAVPLAISLGLAMAGIGFSVMHDANHGAYSTSSRINALVSTSLDVIGGSSYVWRYKHNVLHHTYPNVDSIDDDLDSGGVLRMTPTQQRRWFHRTQHLYELPVLGLLAAKWHLLDDWVFLIRGRIGAVQFPRPRGRALAVFIAGKIIFFTWGVVVPLAVHGAAAIVAMGITSIVLGMTLGIVFQLAHVCEQTQFVDARARFEASWAEHQVATTVDFATHNRWLSWYVGGLNFQVEHHLFPRVSHIHYPALASIVRETCEEFGVPLYEHATLEAALGAHFAHLQRLGRPGCAAPTRMV